MRNPPNPAVGNRLWSAVKMMEGLARLDGDCTLTSDDGVECRANTVVRCAVVPVGGSGSDAPQKSRHFGFTAAKRFRSRLSARNGQRPATGRLGRVPSRSREGAAGASYEPVVGCRFSSHGRHSIATQGKRNPGASGHLRLPEPFSGEADSTGT